MTKILVTSRRSLLAGIGSCFVTCTMPPSVGILGTRVASAQIVIPWVEIQAISSVISATFAVLSYFTDDTDDTLDKILTELAIMQAKLDSIKDDLEIVKLRLIEIYNLVGLIPDATVNLWILTELGGLASSIQQAAAEAKGGGGGDIQTIRQRLNEYLNLFVLRRSQFILQHEGRYELSALPVATLSILERKLTRIVMAFEHGDKLGNIQDVEEYRRSVAERLRVMARDSYLPFLRECIGSGGDEKILDKILAAAVKQKVETLSKLRISNGQTSVACRNLSSPVEDIIDGKLAELNFMSQQKEHVYADFSDQSISIDAESFAFSELKAIWSHFHQTYISFNTNSPTSKTIEDYYFEWDRGASAFKAAVAAPPGPANCNTIQPVEWKGEHAIAVSFLNIYAEYVNHLQNEIITTGVFKTVKAARDSLESYV